LAGGDEVSDDPVIRTTTGRPSGEAMRLTTDQCRTRLRAARVGYLCTVTPHGQPHAVPVTFTLLPGADGASDRLVTAVDGKPKSTPNLARLRDIAAEPRVCLLTDGYAEDWAALWWARAGGVARVLDTVRETMAERGHLLAALATKYPQYRGAVPTGPVIEITVQHYAGWAAGEHAAH
jgi:PPOX class probable F420-dependent enzyme